MVNMNEKFEPEFQEAYDQLAEGAYAVLEKFCQHESVDLDNDDKMEIVHFFRADVLRRIIGNDGDEK